jgi:hypothetical protein
VNILIKTDTDSYRKNDTNSSRKTDTNSHLKVATDSSKWTGVLFFTEAIRSQSGQSFSKTDNVICQ